MVCLKGISECFCITKEAREAHQSIELNNAVGLNVGNLGTGGNLLDGLLVEGAGVALKQAKLVGVPDTVRARVTTFGKCLRVKRIGPARVSIDGAVGEVVLQDDDVGVGDDVTGFGPGALESDCGEKQGLEELHDCEFKSVCEVLVLIGDCEAVG